MKKLLYVIAIAFASAVAFTSCTEENVAPEVRPSAAGGGGASEDPITL